MKDNQKKNPYDFSGFATVYNVECDDGRTIETGAFDHQDGQKVSLVWRHKHEDMANVLGHGFLVATDKGMRINAKFNNTKSGQQAKTLVDSGDISWLSVWANQVKEVAGRVKKGTIREVSLVLSGKNPGARIDTPALAHGDLFDLIGVDETDTIIIYSGEKIELFDTDDEKEMAHESEPDNDPTVKEVLSSLDDDQKAMFNVIIHAAISGKQIETDDGDDGLNIKSVYDTLTEQQTDVLYYILDAVVKDDAVEHDGQDPEDNKTMKNKKNIFEDDDNAKEKSGEGILSHDGQRELITDAFKTKAMLSDVIMAHAGTYGIDNISVLFPDAKVVDGQMPAWYGRDQEWVSTFMGMIRRVPFSRIKSRYANITADEARARGYITGAEKFEEVFPVFARVTTPQTIYKKQKLDRDDIVDITDFDVVSWLKAEMQMMLKEELARAVLVGDGRSALDPDKIKVENVRPIWTDDDIYAHKIAFATDDDILDIIDGITAAREFYKGSGNPTLFLPSGVLSAMLLVRSVADDRRIYPTEESLRAALRVGKIVEVPVMTGQVRDGAVNVLNLIGILLNPRDYTLGADRGGQVTMFDDFDIDFNQYKYLLETRVSGALTLPKSAIIFEQDSGTPI